MEVKHLNDDHLPLVDQATLALFLESGAFYSHIRRCRRAYAERQALFLELFRGADLPLAFEHTDGGHEPHRLAAGGSRRRRLVPPPADAGFDVPSLSHYSMRPTRPGLVFGFTAFTPEVIRSSFERMRGLLRAAAGEHRVHPVGGGRP